MVPPESLFGAIPTWIGVYLATMLAFGAAGYILHRRVFSLVTLGKRPNRFDRPVRRLFGALPFTLGQKKVLQSVSLLKDRAGLAHFFIFWGFLSFTTSYLLFIFADSIWPPFSETVITETGVKIFTYYLNILATGFIIVLVWAGVRRWVVRPSRLSFDLTQKKESLVILLLIALLMALTLLTEAFYVAAGGEGPHASAPIGGALGRAVPRTPGWVSTPLTCFRALAGGRTSR